jgi:hypothetical protein
LINRFLSPDLGSGGKRAIPRTGDHNSRSPGCNGRIIKIPIIVLIPVNNVNPGQLIHSGELKFGLKSMFFSNLIPKVDLAATTTTGLSLLTVRFKK